MPMGQENDSSNQQVGYLFFELEINLHFYIDLFQYLR
ncbi:unnamed protein product [Schistosoma mattheei]|uniref:Uncharacterized protein n=1 Tax=Schistosoma mattheei TaxID=31246 RepID=A0A3P7YTA8_9TREM|nr:unnamed protein product [Schistosoma mattheei]